jgi:hypothetical protein
MELWGGHECTVNRVADRFCDQNRLTGHDDRIEDLQLFAELGVKALRYPVLWERAGPERPGAYDFSWSDARLTDPRPAPPWQRAKLYQPDRPGAAAPLRRLRARGRRALPACRGLDAG